jgi:hypothetical protein
MQYVVDKVVCCIQMSISEVCDIIMIIYDIVQHSLACNAFSVMYVRMDYTVLDMSMVRKV